MSERLNTDMITPSTSGESIFQKNGRSSAQSLHSLHSVRMTQILQKIPPSAVTGAHWATRTASTNASSDPTESLRLQCGTSSSSRSCTPLLPSKGASAPAATLRSSDLHCGLKAGSSSSDFHIGLKKGSSSSDLHIRPKAGSSSSDLHIRPKAGSSSSDLHIRPKAGSSSSDLHIRPKAGSSSSDLHIRPNAGSFSSDLLHRGTKEGPYSSSSSSIRQGVKRKQVCSSISPSSGREQIVTTTPTVSSQKPCVISLDSNSFGRGNVTSTSIFSDTSHRSFNFASRKMSTTSILSKTKSDQTPASTGRLVFSPENELSNDQENIQSGINAIRSDELSDIEEPSQIVLSVCLGHGMLGAAFFDVGNGQIYVVEDKVESAPDFWVMRTLFREQKPRWVLIAGRQDAHFFRTVRELCGDPSTPLNTPTSRQQEKNDDENSTSTEVPSGSQVTPSAAGGCTLKVLPMGDFKYELCLRRVLSLVLPGEPEGVTDVERELYVRGRVNTDLIQMTRALGALLRFIDKNGANLFTPTHLEGSYILGIHVYAMEKLSQLDDVTACTLQLFSEDQHPAASKSGKMSASKEGLSLYALLSRTSCPMSPHALRRILLRPVMDTEVLEARYTLIEWGVDPSNLETVKKIQTSMKNITNVTHIMNRLQRGQLTIRDWKGLYKSLYSAILVGELCQAQDQSIPIFKQTGTCVTEGLYHASFLIQRILDMDESERKSRFVVKPGVDAELDEKKRRYSGLGELLRRVAESELTHLPEEVETCSIIYLPHVGYLLAFPATPMLDQSLSSSDYNLPGLEFMFRTPEHILYKSFTCCEMDRELGDIQVDIANHETRIMMRLVESLLQQAQSFVALVDNILMLDCLLAFSLVSREFGWVKPELTDEPILEVIDARHPLYEVCTPTFVANPISSGPPNPYVTLITGPNASGKTVYLKQVGVVVALSQIGCWVPASRARLKPMDAIITVTLSTPPVTASLSCFMLDLCRMCNALSRATRDSLVIIDEFGAATYENDGASLLAACLDYLCERAVPRYGSPISQDKFNPYSAPPHVFVSTHLLQVYDHLQYQEAVRCLALEAVEEDGSLVHLYQISEGRAKKSYASAVAALSGIPQNVVQRANQVCKSIRKGRLPTRSPFLDDSDERERFQTIVSLLQSHNLASDPVDELLNNIRKYATPLLKTPTPASQTPSDRAEGITPPFVTPAPIDKGASNHRGQSDSNNRPSKGGKPPPSSPQSSKKALEPVISPRKFHPPDEEGIESSNSDVTPLNWKVEAVYSTGTPPLSESDRSLSLLRNPPESQLQRRAKTNVKGSSSSTSKPTDRSSSSSSYREKSNPKTALITKRFPSTGLFADSSSKSSKSSEGKGSSRSSEGIDSRGKIDGFTIHGHKNAQTSKQTPSSGHELIPRVPFGQEASSQSNSEEQESMFCSQESLVLQSHWATKKSAGHHDTQGFQTSTLAEIEF